MERGFSIAGFAEQERSGALGDQFEDSLEAWLFGAGTGGGGGVFRARSLGK